MILTSKRHYGFTLVELLVVMAIVGTLISLVGGLALDSYQKFQIKAELVTVERLFQTAANRAYLLEKDASVKVETASIQLARQNQTFFVENFSHLTFKPIAFELNSVGIYSIEKLDVKAGGRLRTLKLNE